MTFGYDNKTIECALCGCEMKEWESNNPQPLLPDMEDRVCRDCNDYVTASRIILRGADRETLEHICNIIAGIISMASGLRKGRESWMKKMEEE
jgi:hypothetical protein